jgi:hypothetical protein
MAAQRKAGRIQPGPPTFPRPDRRRVVENTAFFFLLGQPGELGVEGTIARAERLVASKTDTCPFVVLDPIPSRRGHCTKPGQRLLWVL